MEVVDTTMAATRRVDGEGMEGVAAAAWVQWRRDGRRYLGPWILIDNTAGYISCPHEPVLDVS